VWTVHLPDCKVSLAILLRVNSEWQQYDHYVCLKRPAATALIANHSFWEMLLKFWAMPLLSIHLQHLFSGCNMTLTRLKHTKDGGDLEKQCLLWLFNRMLANYFLEHLSAGTVVYKSNDESDVCNYSSGIAELFAMLLEQKTASWAEEHAVEAKGQADFREDYRTRQHCSTIIAS